MGAISPPFRAWSDESDEAQFAERPTQKPRESGFCLGRLAGRANGKMDRRQSTPLSARGFLAVGDAFTLLSGRRPFAPKWMQRLGLTWLYRMMAEPRRLGPRYLRYNSLFVYYLLRDWLLGHPPAGRVE